MAYLDSSVLLAQNDGGGAAALILMVLYFGIIIGILAGFAATFSKAGEPGWAVIIPIYNVIVMLKIAGKPAWWIILLLIPFVNLIGLTIPFEIARRFGKGGGFGVGLLLLPFIFYPILGFGDAKFSPDITSE